MRTGQICTQSGIYKCTTHSGSRIHIQKGDTFPPCNNGEHGTTWILVTAT